MLNRLHVMLISGNAERFTADFEALQLDNVALTIASDLNHALTIRDHNQFDLVIADLSTLPLSIQDVSRHFGCFTSPQMHHLVVVLPNFDQSQMIECLNSGVHHCLVAPIGKKEIKGVIDCAKRESSQHRTNGAFYKSFPDDNPFPVCRIINEGLELIYVNPAFQAKLNKLTQHQALQLMSFIEDAIEKHQEKEQIVFKRLEIGKSRYQVTFSIQQLFTTVYFSDITALREVEQVMSEKEFLHKTILDNIPADIGVFDEHIRYVYVNPNGIKNDEIRKWIIGKTDADYIAFRKPADLAPFERRNTAFNQAIKEKRMAIWYDNYQTENGPVHIKRVVHPVFDENGKLMYLIGYGTDITETVMAENATKNLAIELTLQNEGLRRFAYIISHDLRAPSINLKTLLELYNEKDPAHPKNAEIVSRLKISADRINETLNDLLEVTRIKDKAQAEPKSDCQISKLWKDCLVDQASQLQEIGVNVNESFDSNDTVYFNKLVLNSVFTNLISNAIKYRSSDRSLVLAIATIKKDNWFEIRVSDNGIGLDVAKYRNRIFSLYQRFHTHVEGKGLGLFLVRSQLESLGAQLAIESEVGKGTTFTISIPC